MTRNDVKLWPTLIAGALGLCVVAAACGTTEESEGATTTSVLPADVDESSPGPAVDDGETSTVSRPSTTTSSTVEPATSSTVQTTTSMPDASSATTGADAAPSLTLDALDVQALGEAGIPLPRCAFVPSGSDAPTFFADDERATIQVDGSFVRLSPFDSSSNLLEADGFSSESFEVTFREFGPIEEGIAESFEQSASLSVLAAAGSAGPIEGLVRCSGGAER